MQYKKGLHLLLNIRTAQQQKLYNSDPWKTLINEQVTKHGLQKVGEVYHTFDGGGFTAIHALTESHVSIHTWPEYGLCTCDIFLSNFQKDNHPVVIEIGHAIVDFFVSTDFDWKEVER